MKKKNIAILAGGYTGEADVSRNGAKVVESNMDRKLYNMYTIHINKDKWFYKQSTVDSRQSTEKTAKKEILVDKDDFSLTLNGKKIKFDCIFNVIHGSPGEDGRLQGYFDMLGIPYTNSGVTASSITYNKNTTNIFAVNYGVSVPKSLLIRSQQSAISSQQNIDLIVKELGLPMIVKPNNGGSSVGMSKVNKKTELKAAIIKAFKEDDEVIIQEFVKGTEITCGMIRKKGEIIALPLTEVVTSNSFFDYEAKYTSGKSKEITPARVSKDIENECKKISMMLYEKLGCKGMVRMDYIVRSQKSEVRSQKKKEKHEMYLLDINTVPGLSEASIVPQQAKEAGMSLKELYDIVINEALSI